MIESEPIIFHNITLSQFPQKVFVMGDDDQLEIRVALTFIYDTTQFQGQNLSS